MKKITSLIVALIFTITIGLAVINSAKSAQNSHNHIYATINPNPTPGPEKKK